MWIIWEKIAIPKTLGGWGLKNMFLFSKALTPKSGWRLLKTTSLWTRVVFQKYIAPDTLEGWIINPSKERTGVLVIWKAVRKLFFVIREGLDWMLGNDHRVRLEWTLG